MIPGLLARRHIVVAASLATYLALVFVGLARVEVPGLGLGHFLYLPIALLALATGPAWGALAGTVAAGSYMISATLNPHFMPSEDLFSAASAIRFASFAGIGWLVGAAASQNRQLLRRLQEHADRDYLTDLFNTRAFESALTERIERGRPFALLLADVDDLKLVNDTEGHAAGNDYLRRLAAVLREETAPADVVARIGGDEFVVLADLGDGESAETRAQTLRSAVAARDLSASFGHATHPAEGTDRLTLFRTADKRLYEGKLAGTPRRLRSVG